MLISLLALELWQFLFIGDGFDIRLSFVQYLRYVFNEKLLNVTKCQI